jgi:hypothetical protein
MNNSHPKIYPIRAIIGHFTGQMFHTKFPFIRANGQQIPEGSSFIPAQFPSGDNVNTAANEEGGRKGTAHFICGFPLCWPSNLGVNWINWWGIYFGADGQQLTAHLAHHFRDIHRTQLFEGTHHLFLAQFIY